MKLLLLAASVAACAYSATTLISDLNSLYVDGVSRFIWMPDGEGIPHLVDLAAPVEEVQVSSYSNPENEYWLYTRQNPTNAQILKNGDSEALKNSNYSPTKGIRLISHGWYSNGNSPVNPKIRDAFLNYEDVNVFVLDWHVYSHYEYITATTLVPTVGKQLGEFLVWLISNAGGDWNNVHLVGHSLGGHVVGNAYRTEGVNVARVTGLDPAGPGFSNNPNALNKQSGRYVEAIHTDAGVLGLHKPVAHADFYPNGGHSPQPGCLTSFCSHDRSWKLFAASVLDDHFVGRLCDTEDDAHDNKCDGTTTLNMGNDIMTKQGLGICGLTTGSEYPY